MENLNEIKDSISKLLQIALSARQKRLDIILKYKKQKTGNVKIELPHNCTYVYGQTIKIPTIVFPDGNTITDIDLFSSLGWSKITSK